MHYSQPEQYINRGFPFIRLGEVMDHSALAALLIFGIVGFYIIKITAFLWNIGGAFQGFRRCVVDRVRRLVSGGRVGVLGLVCKPLRQGRPGCSGGGVVGAGGGGAAQDGAWIKAQKPGGPDDCCVSGLPGALEQHPGGLSGHAQGSGQGGGAGVSAAQLLEQFGWAHFDSPAYWRRLPSDFVLARKQLVDVADLCPGLPPVQGSAYGHPAFQLELPGVPAVNRGPVVAVVRLGDVKRVAKYWRRVVDYWASGAGRGVSRGPASRRLLEVALLDKSSWVAWSEPAQKLADSIAAQPAVVAPDRGPVVAVVGLGDVRRAVSWCVDQLGRGRVPPRDELGFKRAWLIGSDYVAMALPVRGAA